MCVCVFIFLKFGIFWFWFWHHQHEIWQISCSWQNSGRMVAEWLAAARSKACYCDHRTTASWRSRRVRDPEHETPRATPLRSYAASCFLETRKFRKDQKDWNVNGTCEVGSLSEGSNSETATRSWAVQGLLRFLLGATPAAKRLRLGHVQHVQRVQRVQLVQLVQLVQRVYCVLYCDSDRCASDVTDATTALVLCDAVRRCATLCDATPR